MSKKMSGTKVLKMGNDENAIYYHYAVKSKIIISFWLHNNIRKYYLAVILSLNNIKIFFNIFNGKCLIMIHLICRNFKKNMEKKAEMN
jgi:hypothetical protein